MSDYQTVCLELRTASERITDMQQEIAGPPATPTVTRPWRHRLRGLRCGRRCERKWRTAVNVPTPAGYGAGSAPPARPSPASASKPPRKEPNVAANNQALLIGRVGRDPETRTIASGRTVCKFSLAVNRPVKDKDGNSITDWFNVDIWGRQAELAGELIRKGALISVTGAVNIDEYTDRDGNRQRMVKIAADAFQLLEGKGERNTSSAVDELEQARLAGRLAEPDDDDSIPPF